MSPLEIVVVIVCSTVGFTLQGSVGFGVGLFSAPILILIDARLVPGPLLASTMLFTMLLLTVREHRTIDLGGLRWALFGRLVGTVPAAVLLAVLPTEQLSLLFGGIVILAVAISLSGLRLEPGPVTLLVGGTLSGLMATIASVGGPPLALLYQHESGARVRGTLSSFFLVGTILSLVALSLVGHFGREELYLAIVLLPGMLLGFVVSRRITPRLDRGYTRLAVLTTAGLAGLAVVGRYFASQV